MQHLRDVTHLDLVVVECWIGILACHSIQLILTRYVYLLDSFHVTLLLDHLDRIENVGGIQLSHILFIVLLAGHPRETDGVGVGAGGDACIADVTYVGKPLGGHIILGA